MNGVGAEADKAADVVALLDVAGLDDEGAAVAQPLVAQVRMDGAQGQQRRDGGQAIGEGLAVGQAEDVVAVVDGALGLAAQAVQAGFRRASTPPPSGNDRREAS